VPSVERCSTLITPKTNAIALVTPNNPVRFLTPHPLLLLFTHYHLQTGATYPPSLLSSFANLAKERSIALIIDETYRDFNTPPPPHTPSSPPPHPSPGAHTSSTSSYSPNPTASQVSVSAHISVPPFLTQLKTVLDCLQICPSRPAQLALAPLLPALRPFIRWM
jgi:Aspartate/tyrosine/aromatic aminotransferase